MRLVRSITLAVLTLLVTAGPAVSQNVHLKGGANAEPTFTDQGLKLAASGELAGLGNEDLRVDLAATGNPVATCTNPSGKNQPPGQNPAPVSLSGTQSIQADEIDKNGNAPFNVVTAPPVTPIAGAPDCPNPQWTETVTDVAFTSATLKVYQPPDNPVLTVECKFSRPTRDGPVASGNVSCTSN